MKIARLLSIIIMLSLAAMAGCQTSAPQGDIIDDLGRNVQIKNVPQRIISLSPSNTEIVYALGLEDRLIGVTTYCNYPPEVKDKIQVSQFSNIDIEKVVALEPDLILADSLHEADVIPALERLGITVLAINPATMEDILADIGMIGRAAGQTESAESLIASLRNRTKAVTDRTAGLESEEKYRTFFVTWHDPIWTAGNGTLIDDIITMAGGTNIAADVKGHSQIDLETVIQRNPQVILVLSSMGTQDNSYNYIKTEPRFQATDALKNDMVYMVDADIISRTTPRSVDGLEQIAKIIHPELFP